MGKIELGYLPPAPESFSSIEEFDAFMEEIVEVATLEIKEAKRRIDNLMEEVMTAVDVASKNEDLPDHLLAASIDNGQKKLGILCEEIKQ